MTDPTPPAAGWQIDRKVPVAVIAGFVIAIVVQSMGFGAWLAHQDGRLAELERGDKRILERGDERFGALRGRLEVLERDRDRIIRVEEKLGFVGDAVKRIEQKLDQR